MRNHYLRPLTILATSFSALALSCAGDERVPPSEAAPLLTKSSVLSSTDECPSGGVKIEMGADTDGDGTLDEDEVTSETLLCNGEDGTNGNKGTDGKDGTNGTKGQDGKDGSRSLVRVSDLSSGAECPSGGYLVEAGLDNGDGGEVAEDGVLGDGEVDSESYACSGINGFSVLSLLSADASGTCVHGGYRLDVGLDNGDGSETERDGTLGSGEIDSSAYLCNGDDGADGTNGTDGEDGTSGSDGLTSLVKTSSEGPGLNCTYGGTRIEIGLDDSDDGVLDAGEVDTTNFACDGQDGADGSSGQDGSDGANGLTALVALSSEANGSNCTNGGTRIDVGLDDDGDQILDPGEIDSTSYVCDGADGQDGTDGAPGQDGNDGAPGQDGNDGAPGQDGNDGAPGQDGNDGTSGSNGLNALVKQTAISAEGTCSGAGIRIDSGLDTSKDNVLDPGEIQATQYLCEGGGSGSAGLKVVDADGDVLGDALSSDATGVTVRTSTGHITVLGWDGAPVPLKYVDFTGAGCTGDVKIYVDLGGASIHEKSAYWSQFHSAFLVPSGTAVGGVIAPVSGSFVSYFLAGGTCTAFSGTELEWPASVQTPANIGLGMTINAPLSLQ